MLCSSLQPSQLSDSSETECWGFSFQHRDNHVLLVLMFKTKFQSGPTLYSTGSSSALDSRVKCAFMEILTNLPAETLKRARHGGLSQLRSPLPQPTTRSATGSPFLPVWHVQDMSCEAGRKDQSTQHPYQKKTGYRSSRVSAEFQSFSSADPRLPSCTSLTSQDAELQPLVSFFIRVFIMAIYSQPFLVIYWCILNVNSIYIKPYKALLGFCVQISTFSNSLNFRNYSGFYCIWILWWVHCA